jgi:tetratricopeptide (TPR) repeat protein
MGAQQARALTAKACIAVVGGSMNTRHFTVGLAGLWLLLLASGCGSRKEITDLDRKEAAHLTAEAEFAMTLREWTRAESLLTKAVDLCPDTGPYWVNLGGVRRRMGNRDGARTAYQSALAAYRDQTAGDEKNADVWLQQVYVLALLGQHDDARKLVGKMAGSFPENRSVRAFVEGRQLDALLVDPQFKAMAL